MKNIAFLPVSKLFSVVVASAVILLGVGCGGGGSGLGTNPPTDGSCNASTYTPNYAPTSNSPGSSDFLLRWNAFPIRTFIEPTEASKLTRIVAGLNAWVDATGGRASYEVVTRRSDADLVIDYGALEGMTLGQAVTRYFSNSGIIIDSLIVLDLDKIDSFSSPGALLQTVAAHEFGHSLGLHLHSPHRIDLMFASAGSGLPTVTTRDLNTLMTAYCNVFPARGDRASTAGMEGPIATVTHSLGRDGCLCANH